MIVEEFKPCPFCGGKPIVISDSSGGDTSEDYYWVECTDCGTTQIDCVSDSESEAIKKWNVRIMDKQYVTVEQVKSIVNEILNNYWLMGSKAAKDLIVNSIEVSLNKD